ncbi:MAG: hypothetical protein IKJ91_02260 [Clostridia bacterium]|nr:hypothetical protein [Clostridia bacterium]
MKKLFILVFASVLLLCSCGDAHSASGETEKATESVTEAVITTEAVTEKETETEPVTTEAVTPEQTEIENIGDYAVIYAKESSKAVKNAAKDLVADIYMETDILIATNDDGSAEVEYEIIVGETERSIEGYEYGSLPMGGFVIKQVGKKIIVDGGSEGALKKAIKYFCMNFIAGGAVKLPYSGEYAFIPVGFIDKIEIDGTVISEYTVLEDLYHDAVAEDFISHMEMASGITLPLKSAAELKEMPEKYILLSDTNTDFSSYSVKVEDGNVILSANYTTIDECIETFFSEMLGYDINMGKIIKEGAAILKSGDERKINIEKKTPYTKEKLMSVLTEVYNSENIIVGQHMSAYRYGETLTTERALYFDNIGVECPLFGFDVAEAQTSGTKKYPWNAQVKDAYDMIEYAREGGIFTFSCHFPNPSGLPKGLAAYRGELGDGTVAAWDALLTEGTEYNKNFMDTLERVGDFLMIFHENGVPIIYRPLHEMNGNWFWFCIVNGEQDNTIPKEYAVRLWRLIYDYLVHERGITSMIWEYSPNVAEKTTSTKVDVMYCYPGDEYCDIVGCDWYTGSYKGHDVLRISHDAISKTGKIFSITEFGPGDGIRTNYAESPEDKFTCLHLDDIITEVTEAGIKTCYWLLWSSWSEVRISMWNMGDGRNFYGNDIYLTLEDTYKLLYE